MSDYIDYLSSREAGQLARKIERFWHKRGHTQVRVEKFELGNDFPGSFGVRSNLVNGMPPSK